MRRMNVGWSPKPMQSISEPDASASRVAESRLSERASAKRSHPHA
jgi:hypothetical protein